MVSDQGSKRARRWPGRAGRRSAQRRGGRRRHTPHPTPRSIWSVKQRHGEGRAGRAPRDPAPPCPAPPSAAVLPEGNHSDREQLVCRGERMGREMGEGGRGSVTGERVRNETSLIQPFYTRIKFQRPTGPHAPRLRSVRLDWQHMLGSPYRDTRRRGRTDHSGGLKRVRSDDMTSDQRLCRPFSRFPARSSTLI